MVSLVAFLTVTNIALGYGLAVYVHRHFGTLVLSRSKSPQHSLQTAAGRQEAPAAQVEPIAKVEQQAMPKAPEVQKQAAVEVPPSAEPVEEEQVLAGIEEFRSQLAKMNEATDDSAEAAPEAQTAEPVAAAN